MSTDSQLTVRLSHVCLSSSSLSKTIQFYSGLLGFKVIHEFVNPQEEKYGVIFACGNGTFLEVFKSHAEGKIEENMECSSTEGFRHLCFQVEDINAAAKIFMDSGIDVRQKLVSMTR